MKKKKKENLSGLFIPAGIFLGMGFGFLLGELVAGMFIGLGVGFLGMLLCNNMKKRPEYSKVEIKKATVKRVK